MKKSTSVALLCAVMAAAVALHFIKGGLDYRRYAHDVAEELMYYPSGRLLSVADLGYGPVIADVMWLRGIQYYGEHRRTDAKYPLAEHIFSTITNLDPGFLGAYRFGAMVLAEDVGTPAAAIGLLKKGLRSNPESWEIPFDLGFIYFIALDDYAKAAHYFRFASRLEDSPEVTKRFTAFAYRKAGRTDLAKALWEEIYRSTPNRVMREAAEFSLKRIEMDETIRTIAEAAERYRQAKGASPRGLSDLVAAGLVGGIPRDPFGGSYFVDPGTGTVSSTTRVEGDAETAQRALGRAIKRYADLKGHYPQSLTELKQEGLIAEIPTVVGAEVTYDPATGRVGFDFVWSETRQ